MIVYAAMPRHPSNPPKHVRSSVGVTVLDGEGSRIRDCEWRDAWTVARLDPARRVDWDATTPSG